MVIVLALVVIILSAINITGVLMSGPIYRGPITDHFNGKRFTNPTGIKAKGFGDVLKWMFTRKRGPWKEQMNIPPGPKPPIRVEDGVRITFVNHSTFLIQVDGINIITDPVWSKRTSPFSFMGPKRMRPPGIKLEDLPAIDYILLSHNHYDHFDLATLRQLISTHKPKVVAPLGVGDLLTKYKLPSENDLDWWDEHVINTQLKIVATPAQHFSSRGTLDRDASLWCGFMIVRPKGNIYFVGDTGYNDKTFKEIGQRLAPVQVALVPIGAFKPQWFMSPIHASPAEAVQIHFDINAKTSIATHFGTFPLADDAEGEPEVELQKALAERGLNSGDFIIMDEGEGKSF